MNFFPTPRWVCPIHWFPTVVPRGLHPKKVTRRNLSSQELGGFRSGFIPPLALSRKNLARSSLPPWFPQVGAWGYPILALLIATNIKEGAQKGG
jgi:hypothetical protein